MTDQKVASENTAIDTQRQARRIYIAFCCAATLFMALIVLVATLVIMS
jgi:hypothetical protein